MLHRTRQSNEIARIALISGAAIGIGLTVAAIVRRRHHFAGKSIVITGGSRGLGLVLARQFAREGARVALLARTQQDLRNAEDQIAAYGGEVIAIPCDIRDQAEVEAAMALIIRRFSAIDVLVNNAGVIQVGPVENMGIHDFENAMATHFYGPLFCMLEVIPYMRRQGGGRIVNIASIGGKIAVPHLVPYCASKFALVGLSDGMRAELARDQIAVTTVCPWLMRTGSPYNIEVKGHHQREFAWFALGASIPGLTVSAERAARKIIKACRRKAPRLVMSGWGKSAAFANELMPGAIAVLQQLANRMLPRADLLEGDFPRSGWQSRSSLTPDPLMRITQRAALRNNELRHAMRSER